LAPIARNPARSAPGTPGDAKGAAAGASSGPRRQRAPRYRANLPAVVDGRIFMVATSVSEQGCALRWSGRPPFERQAIRLQIGAGASAATLIGVVRWVRTRGSDTTAGVRLTSPDGQARSWTLQISELSRTGTAY